MKSYLDLEGTVEGLRAGILAMNMDEDVMGVLIFACDENGFTAESVSSSIAQCTKPLAGGVYPQILYDTNRYEKGTLCVGITKPFVIGVVEDLESLEIPYEDLLETLFMDETIENQTLFVAVDGLFSQIAKLNAAMFEVWGLYPNYVGGGAGSLSFVQRPCVFTNKGLLQNAAVFALIGTRSGVGVAHGWTALSEAFKVTEVKKNKVISLNWKPAFEVYREVVEKKSGLSLDTANFFSIAKGFPLGILKLSNEVIVRDPIILEDTSLVCVGEIPDNSIVYILEGDSKSLLEGAQRAYELANQSYRACVSTEPSLTLFIDCISRALFLQEDFGLEQELVFQNGMLVGALTLGEIANTGKVFLEFYNKTAVVCLME